jgi:hypothetical protein
MLGLVHVAASEVNSRRSIAFPPHQTTPSVTSVIRYLCPRCIPRQCARRKDEKKSWALVIGAQMSHGEVREGSKLAWLDQMEEKSSSPSLCCGESVT